MKRLLDVVASGAGLVFFSPLLVIFCLAIWLEDRRSPFYVDPRVGRGGGSFRMVKLRSMVVNADRTGVDSTAGDDPRITRVGRFIRSFKLDELSQLWNVFKGDMSLVGPRPLPIRDYYGFDQDWHRRRFSVRPGITCLWQINGRSSIPFEKWMELDMNYIDKWSLWLDFKILTKTIPSVWKGSGAV